MIGGGDDRLDEAVHAHARGEERSEVAVLFLVVGVARDVVDVVVRVREHDPFPIPERRHVPVRRATRDQLDRRVELAQRLGRARGECAVLVGTPVPELPGSVHLVAEEPRGDAERFGAPVGDPLVGQRRAGRTVGVLDQVERFERAPGTEVDRQHQIGTELVDPRGELVEPDRVGLRRAPRQVAAARAQLGWADAVLPPEPGHEVAARVADRVDVEFAGGVEHVAPEAVLVGGGVIGLVDAAVHGPADVLHERSEQAPAHRADGEGRVDDELGVGDVGPVRSRLGGGHPLMLPSVSPDRIWRWASR